MKLIGKTNYIFQEHQHKLGTLSQKLTLTMMWSETDIHNEMHVSTDGHTEANSYSPSLYFLFLLLRQSANRKLALCLGKVASSGYGFRPVSESSSHVLDIWLSWYLSVAAAS